MSLLWIVDRYLKVQAMSVAVVDTSDNFQTGYKCAIYHRTVLSMYHVCLQFYIMYGLDIFCNSAKEVGGSPNKSKEEEAY